MKSKAQAPDILFRENVYSITIPNVLDYKIHFVFSTNIQKSWLKRFSTNDIVRLGQADGLHSSTDRGHSWLFFKEDVGISTFVHECWHSVWALLQWAEISMDNELIAYTLGFVVSKGQQFHAKNDLKIRRKK